MCLKHRTPQNEFVSAFCTVILLHKAHLLIQLCHLTRIVKICKKIKISPQIKIHETLEMSENVFCPVTLHGISSFIKFLYRFDFKISMS